MFRPIALVLSLAAMPAAAEVPTVVTDIAPVHSLVAQVMAGAGEPRLLIRPGQSPHGYSLRPSDAQGLQDADLFVWIGPALSPWLAKPVQTLVGEAEQLVLLDIEGLPLLHFGEAGDGDGHDHDHEGATDPHAWLDPEIAAVWVGAVAEALARTDPENAPLYHENAQQAREALRDLDGDLAAALAPVRDEPYVTFHDAYRYLEARYGLTNAGTVSPGDASDPGAGRISGLKGTVEASGIRCAFAEPQFSPALLRIVGEGMDLTIAELDPTGARLEQGPGLYPALMRGLAASLVACLAAPE